jgi:hypothetical protein
LARQLHVFHPCGFKQTSLPADHGGFILPAPASGSTSRPGFAFMNEARLRWTSFEIKVDVEQTEFLAVQVNDKRRIEKCNPAGFEVLSLLGRIYW